MGKEFRNLQEEYEKIKKIIVKTIYTRNDQEAIGLFKIKVNYYAKKSKVPKFAINNFNGAIDNVQKDRTEFIINGDIIFKHMEGRYWR